MTTLDIFEQILTGVFMYFANSAIYLFTFAMMFGFFSMLLLKLRLWKKR